MGAVAYRYIMGGRLAASRRETCYTTSRPQPITMIFPSEHRCSKIRSSSIAGSRCWPSLKETRCAHRSSLISSMRANLRRYVRSICSRWARMSISWRKFPMKRSMPCSHVNRMMPLLKWTDGPSSLCRSLSSAIRNGSALRSWWGMSTGTGTNHRSTVDAVVLRPSMTA